VQKILLIRALKGTVQEVIPSERGSLKRGCLFLCSSLAAFDVYIPGLRRSDRFLRRTAPPCHKELCPFFSLTFFTQPSWKLLPMSSLNPSFLPKALTTIIVLVNS